MYRTGFIVAFLLSATICTAGARASAVADNVLQETPQTGDSAFNYRTLHENAPKVENRRDVPRFALLGKEGKFYMGFGANIKLIGAYDFGHPVDNPDLFTTSAIPMTIPGGDNAQIKFSAAQSNIYMNIVAMPGSKDQLGAYASIIFTGNDYTPGLEHGYLKYRDITAGYTYSIFTDAAALPATIDYQGPNAFTSVIHGMIAFEPRFGREDAWKAGMGLDIPAASCTNALHTATLSQRVPDIPFYLQRNWAGGEGWMRLSGIVRNICYRDETSAKNQYVTGWGVKVSGTAPVAGGLKAYFQALYGSAISSYIQDLTGCGMDLVPDAGNPGRLQPVKAWAGYGALHYVFSPKVTCTAIYSHVRTYAGRYDDTLNPWGSEYKYAQYVLGNVFYNINSIVQVGAEYIYGRRVNRDGEQAHDNRVEAMIQVSF
ncbi:MAG: hypothetical protein NC204_00230 [Candidatus Amulumruptor caecigallinarius]|nr:hypothetical protein [Candidatus Amulumruptor caecigallinarius]